MLKVDIHEEKVIKILKNKMVQHKIEVLPVGDFVYRNVCIERKTITDLISSIKSGHLQKQLIQMEQSFPMNVLIVVGSYRDLQDTFVVDKRFGKYNPISGGWTVNKHLGSLASIIVRYPKIKIVQVDSEKQLVNIMMRIITKAVDGKSTGIYDTELLKNSLTIKDIKTRIFASIPLIGLEKAKLLSENFDILIVDKDGELINHHSITKIDGIGPKIADRVMEVIK